MDGTTAVHAACWSGRVRAVEALGQLGAAIDVASVGASLAASVVSEAQHE
jgi:ankyrin repeat protein